MRARVWAAVIVLTSLVAVSPAVAAPARAATGAVTHPPPSRPISWLGAGDSYSSGQGLAYTAGPCAQGQAGDGHPGAWPLQAASLVGPQTQADPVLLVACSGGRTGEFDAAQGSNPAEWTPSMGRWDLVSFTFGGDDVHFPDVIQACLGVSLAGFTGAVAAGGAGLGDAVLNGFDPLPPALEAPGAALTVWRDDPLIHCPSDSDLRREIADNVGALYTSFLHRVEREAVTPGGNIVVLGYPEIVEDPKLWAPADKSSGLCQGIRTSDAYELRGLAGDLNATIAQAVASFNALSATIRDNVAATYVDVNTGNPNQGIGYGDPNLFEPSSGPRHNLCSAQPWINGISYHIAHSFHPNEAGNAAMANLVKEAFPTLDWSRLTNPTRQVDVAPVDSASVPKDGYALTDGGTAQSCSAGSDAVGQAYRCFSGNGVYDPCWSDLAAPADDKVICFLEPWDTSATVLTDSQGGLEPFPPPVPPIDRSFPWGLQLADGEKCVALQGAHDSFNGRVVDYRCGSGYNHVVLRGLNQSGPVWTADTAYFQTGGTTYTPGPTMAISTAWYALPDTGSATVAKADACTATALAYAAQNYELANNSPDGPLPTLTAFACSGGWAAIDFGSVLSGGYGAVMVIQSTPNGWHVTDAANLLQPGTGGLPANLANQFSGQLNEPFQNLSVPF